MSVSGAPPSGGVLWLGEGGVTLVGCVYSMCVFSVEEGRRLWASRSAVAIVSHERNDTGWRSGHLEEGVLEELLGCGSL